MQILSIWQLLSLDCRLLTSNDCSPSLEAYTKKEEHILLRRGKMLLFLHLNILPTQTFLQQRSGQLLILGRIRTVCGAES